MTKRTIPSLSGAALILGALTACHTDAADAPKPFGTATLRFEQNATDGDFEVVIEAKGETDGLLQLVVTSPDGRTVLDFKAPDATTLGIRQFRMESPEPGDVASIRAAYPEGVYSFTGTTAGGVHLQSKATLKHALPAKASFVRPRAEAQAVATEKVVIEWTPVPAAVAYMVAIEQEEQNLSVSARLAGSVAKFAVPDGFMHPDTEYKLAIGTVAKDGNVTYVETTIKTAVKKVP